MNSVIARKSPSRPDQILPEVVAATATEIDAATRDAKESWNEWRSLGIEQRAEILKNVALLLRDRSAQFVEEFAIEIGKPVRYGKAEIERSAALLLNVAQYSSGPLEVECEPNAFVRYVPVGVIALITPWNNPVAIPLGKIAPALLYGNMVVWKPSPAANDAARRLLSLFLEAGCFPQALKIVSGDASTAETLMNSENIDAVTLSGSFQAGHAAHKLCAQRVIPFQGELGGNNASIVWPDCDLETAATLVAEGAFGFAGQRCTANRRAVVHESCYHKFLVLVQMAVTRMGAGDPQFTETQIGPLVSSDSRKRVAAIIDRAVSKASKVITLQPSSFGQYSQHTYHDPVLVCADDPQVEIVQQETFGPVLVIQKATSWEDALALCNGVRQGLVASLFSDSKEIQQKFLFEAEAGILKINRATSDAGVNVPFGGWKHSGIGPPEHGSSNREFYTRTQSVYR